MLRFGYNFAIGLDENYNRLKACISVTEHSMNATERTIIVAQRSRALHNTTGVAMFLYVTRKRSCILVMFKT